MILRLVFYYTAVLDGFILFGGFVGCQNVCGTYAAVDVNFPLVSVWLHHDNALPELVSTSNVTVYLAVGHFF